MSDDFESGIADWKVRGRGMSAGNAELLQSIVPPALPGLYCL
ncbi:MAG: hypothetical protein ACM3U2_01145 [Deltaproteobacteria bacterium]